MSRRKRDVLALGLGQHFKLVSHALARKINRPQFERAPFERRPRWMHKNVIDSANEIPAVIFIVAGSFPFGREAVQKSDFAQDTWFRALEKLVTHPLEYSIPFKEAIWACGDQRPDSNDRIIVNLFILAERTHAALLVAFGIFLERTTSARQGVQLKFDFALAEPLFGRHPLETGSVPFADGISSSDLWLFGVRHLI
jgi:hypothetical protein